MAQTYKVPGITDELRDMVLDICSDYDKEDKQERETRRPLWLKLENYFHGLQLRYWNMIAQDWRVLPDDDGTINETSNHYDEIINEYRAHAESIIAALSIKSPNTIFYPEDADVIEDLQTSEACTKIKALIERHNDAKLLLIKTLMILFNQGTVAYYIYNRKDKGYGIYSKPKYGENAINVSTILQNCEECGNNIDEVVFKGEEKRELPEESKECPVCGHKGIPMIEQYDEEIPEIVGYTEEPKTRTRVEAFSPLWVQMPFYARRQELVPWIKLKFEQHYSLLRASYPTLYKKNLGPFGGRVYIDNERQLGASVTNRNLVTTECIWVRPWGYHIYAGGMNNDDSNRRVKKLLEKFPDGFYAIILDGTLVEITNEALDDHWQISESPLEDYIHADPLGKPMAPIQDMINELNDLQLDTFRHAIPETFVEASTVNMKEYGKSRATPGMMYPAKGPEDGQPLGSKFHTIKTATLSQESDVFGSRLSEKGQFALGSFPSIYGGPSTSGSKTAKEYESSRAMALQRLQITWSIVKSLWAKGFGKAVQLYIHAIKTSGQDEKFVIKDPRNNTRFINQWIKQTELTGRIGRIESDSEEDMPLSAGQLRDTLMNLIGLKDEYIASAIYHPENTPLVKKALGAPDFYIPNSDVRDKQWGEIQLLLSGEQVEVKEWENHSVEAEVCLSFLYSTVGLAQAQSNPEGVLAVEEHMMQHKEAQQMASQPGAENPELGADDAQI